MVRALDNKHRATVILKIGRAKEVAKERDIYLRLEGIPGIPVIYGWCVTNPSTSYISIQPFAEDLYQYIAAKGPMSIRQACEVAEDLVSSSILLFTQDWLTAVYPIADHTFLRTRERGHSLRH